MVFSNDQAITNDQAIRDPFFCAILIAASRSRDQRMTFKKKLEIWSNEICTICGKPCDIKELKYG